MLFRLLILFTVLLFIAYSNTFSAAWQFDDKPNILGNQRVHMTAFEPAQILQSMTAKPGVGGVYRPVAYFTLALNWLFGQDDVFGYHVVNFIIHVLTTMALFFTIRVLLRTPRLDGRYPGGQRTFIAGSAALLWALNPVQTQAVTYIVQRMASLAALFAVLALYFYLKARLASGPSRRAGFHLAALICFILGLLSKENVVLLPLAVPVLEAFFFSEIQFRGRGLMKVALGVGLAVLFCVALGLFLRPDLIDFIIHYYENRPFTLVERLLSEQRILLFYLSLLLFPAPWRLSVEHDIVLSTSLFSPWTTAAAIGGNALLIAGAIKMGRKHPLTALAVLFFYLNHVVESTILPLELIFEHRNYLPSVFLFLPVAQAVNYLVIKWQDNRLRFTGTIVLTAALLGSCGYATHVRNQVWRSEQALWLDALAKAPNSARPMATLAILLAWGDDPTPAKYRKALELTERALSLRMARNLEAEQLGNMASIYERLGETEQALAYYHKALKVAPERVNNRYNLAKTLAKHGLFERARRELEIIQEQGAVHADYFALLGLTHLWQAQPERALTIFRKALRLAPGRPDILLAIGNSLSAMGYYERAQWFIRQAQKAGGHDMVVLLNLLQNALAAGDMAMARKTLDQMLARYPLPMILDLDRLSAERYRNVPLQIGRLQAFITSEIHNSQFSSEQ